jgi:hypothetical protein
MKRRLSLAVYLTVLLLIPLLVGCTGTVLNPQGEVVEDGWVRDTALALEKVDTALTWAAGRIKWSVESGLMTPEKRDEIMAAYYWPAVEAGEKADEALTLYETFPSPENEGKVMEWQAKLAGFLASLLLEVPDVQ